MVLHFIAWEGKMRTQFSCLALATALVCPVSVAQWVQTNGLSGCHVECLLESGTNLFAGTADSGVFRSTSSGTSWTDVNAGLTNTEVLALAASGSNLLAGTFGGGVYRSTDNGTSWSGANAGLTST